MRRYLFILLLLGLTVTAGITLAQSNGYAINWWTLGNGGGISTGGSYELTGTIGQPDASTVLSGGDYSISGGFWQLSSADTDDHEVLLPLVVR